MQWIQYFERITQIDVLLPNLFSLNLVFFSRCIHGDLLTYVLSESIL